MIIGLTGYAGSGKDAVASILVEQYGFTRVAFADPIKDFLLRINPVLDNGQRVNEVIKLLGWGPAKAMTETRRLMQEIGVGAREMFGDDFWINQAFKKMYENDKYVVADVRFANEAKAIKETGGQLWRIRRPEVGPINDHVSERELENYKVDQIFLNNGTLQDLETLVKTRMRAYVQ